MNKLLTISTAAYNVSSTLEETLSSMCLDDIHMEMLEVMITDDGSTDSTAAIARSFEDKHPGTFRLVSRENRGYGSTIETALSMSRGLYFKIVDGDDMVDPRGLAELLDNIKKLADGSLRGKSSHPLPDLVITPFYVMDGTSCKYKEIRKHSLLQESVTEMGSADLSQGLSVFEIACRTDILRAFHPRFLHHCFYVDNEYVMAALLASKTISHFDRPVSIYRTGRPGQSMNRFFLGTHLEDTIAVSDRVFCMYMDQEKKERCRGGKKQAAELLISTCARQAYLAGLLSPRPLVSREKLHHWDRMVEDKSHDLFQITRRSKIARAGGSSGPCRFFVISAAFKVKYGILFPDGIISFE